MAKKIKSTGKKVTKKAEAKQENTVANNPNVEEVIVNGKNTPIKIEPIINTRVDPATGDSITTITEVEFTPTNFVQDNLTIDTSEELESTIASTTLDVDDLHHPGECEFINSNLDSYEATITEEGVIDITMNKDDIATPNEDPTLTKFRAEVAELLNNLETENTELKRKIDELEKQAYTPRKGLFRNVTTPKFKPVKGGNKKHFDPYNYT